MAQELFYTSSPRGLRLGVSGYCTVACTNGMAANYIEVLESLSGYAPVFPPNHPQAVLNPVAYSHYRYTIGGKVVNILSRVGFAGVDYTQRANKFAHHLVLDISERAAGGPAWVMQQPGVMAEKWVGPPKYLDLPKKMPGGDSVPARCSAWERCTGDAGWGAVLAQSFLDNAREPAFIIFEAGMPTLNLVSEAIRLLPKEARWSVTFNTYFTSLPIGTSCAWRFCLKDDTALKQARRTPGALMIDLTAGADQPAEARSRLSKGSAFIEFARSGVAPAVTSSPGPLPRENPELQLLPEPPPSNLPPAITLPPSHSVKRVRTQASQSDIPSSGYVAARPNPLVAVLAVLLGLSLAGNVYLFFFYHPRSASDAKDHTASPPGPTAPATQTTSSQKAADTGAKDAGKTTANGGSPASSDAHSMTQPGNPPSASGAQSETAKEGTGRLGPGNEPGKGASDGTAHRPNLPIPIAQFGKMEEIAKKVTHGAQKEIHVPNISQSCSVVELGWWPTDAKSEPRLQPAASDKPEVTFDGPSQTVGKVTVLTVSFDNRDKKLIFEPGDKSTESQLTHIHLDTLGWVRLKADNHEYVVFTCASPSADIPVHFDNGTLTGEFSTPEILRGIAPQTRSSIEYHLDCQSDDKGKVRVTLSSGDANKPLDGKRDISIPDAVVFTADGNTIASYTVVHNKPN